MPIEQILATLWRASWQASFLIMHVLLAQAALRRWLSPGWRSALWLLVVIRLLLPVTPSSSWSLFNFIAPVSAGRPATAVGWAVNVPTADRSADLRHGGGGIAHSPATMPHEWFGDDAIWILPGETFAASDPDPAATSTALLPKPAANTGYRWLPILFWLWLGGVALLGARIACGVYLLARRIRTGVKLTDPGTLRLLEQLRRIMGVRRAPSLVETDAVDSPALFGLVRPKLLLPPGMLQRLNASELHHVFLHELAHLRRHDVILNWIATSLQILHWFNPIVWFGFARMRADRELACDALVLARSDAVERRAYGATLLKLVSGLTPARPVAGLVGTSEGSLKHRIQSIASYRRPNRLSMFAGAVALLVLAAVNLTDVRANRNAEAGDNGRTEDVPSQAESGNRADIVDQTVPSQNAPLADASTTAPKENDTLPAPNPLASKTPLYAGPGRLAIQSKLDRIILNEVLFDGLALPDVLNYLGTAVRQCDPDQEGITFLINTNPVDWAAAPIIDPTTGQVIQAPKVEPFDMNRVIIRITPPLRNVRLSEVLEAITREADKPIRFSIDEDAIIFAQPPPDAPVQLETRIFKVNANTFLEGLHAVGSFPFGDVVSQGPQGGIGGSGGFGGAGRGIGGGGLPGVTATNLTQNTQQVVRDFFTAARVNLHPPNQIYFSDRKGVLMVRATSAELDVIQQAIEVLNERRSQIAIEPRGVEDIVPEPPRSEPAPDSNGAHHRRLVESKLSNIVIDEIVFDGVPLWKAVRQLEAESILQDPEGHGVRMYLDGPVNALFENPVDAATGHLRAWFDLESIVIRITPPIRKARLGDVLDAMVRVADQPIQYSIRSSGVVFSRKPPEEAARLETRIFKVDPKRFEESLRRIPTLPRLQVVEKGHDGPASVTSTNATEEPGDFGAVLRKFLTAAGVNPWPPNQVYFGDRKGVLMVRATTRELDSLQSALEVFGVPEPRVKLEVRAVELTRTESREMGFDWFLGSTTAQPNGPGVFPGGSGGVPPQLQNLPSAVDAKAGQVMGILTERQFPVVLGALERRRDTSMQTVAVVTASSGQPIRSSWKLADGTPLMLHSLPVVRSDGASLDLTITLTPGETEPEPSPPSDATADRPSWENMVSRRAAVWTGQTIVLGWPMTIARPQVTSEARPSPKQLVVFVTPTIVDPIGVSPHPHHFFDPDTIPPQDPD